jgi:hypothetical protein
VSPSRSGFFASFTPRAAGLAGFLSPRARSLVAALAPCALAALLAAGCGRDGPRVLVVNASGHHLDQLWVRTERDSVRVPPLAPGKSVEVRPRVRGEDLLWVTGRFQGRVIESSGGDYVEGSGGYRFRAIVDSSGHVSVKFVRMGLW